MGSKRKRTRSSEMTAVSGRKKLDDLPWKAVPVDLNGKGNPSFDDMAEDMNHYDNHKMQKAANNDLPVQPGEEVAIFYNLEVVDASAYTASRSKTDTTKDSESAPIGSIDEEPAKGENRVDTNKSNSETSKKKNNNKKKKQASVEKSPVGVDAPSAGEHPEVSMEQVTEVQNTWSAQTGGVMLNSDICKVLAEQRFAYPTPIQRDTLAASILGLRNVVGAAQTGSGKTLAFLLPILQFMFEHPPSHQSILAMIIAPTRELALQIQSECQKFLSNQKDCISLVGGIAVVKQARLLQSQPKVVIGTPGRLWSMISSQKYEHLQNLSKIRFLVLDEADRMVEDSSFREDLANILNAVHAANPLSEDGEEEAFDDATDGVEGMQQIPGLPNVAKVQMLPAGMVPKRDSDEENQDSSEDGSLRSNENIPSDIPVWRQTFIFSATLDLDDDSQWSKSGRGFLDSILERTRAVGKTKVVDLTNKEGRSTSKAVASSNRLPEGLDLQHIRCTQKHKDACLYAYLLKYSDKLDGPTLVFCNSIAGIRRVQRTLQTLQIQSRQLHAQMQQRARLKLVDKLAEQGNRTVVVCTDVAARGLDIPGVAAVVHYDIPRNSDIFVHRSGRTARGVGSSAHGVSISLLSAADSKPFDGIIQELEVTTDQIVLDGYLLDAAKERARLASQAITADTLTEKKDSDKNWMTKNAAEADLLLDDETLEELEAPSTDEANQLKQGQLAKKQLKQLLAEPIRERRFGKFLANKRPN